MSSTALPPCPHEDCTEPGHHWREGDGTVMSHSGSTCTDPWSPTNRSGCVGTRHPAAAEAKDRLYYPEAWK